MVVFGKRKYLITGILILLIIISGCAFTLAGQAATDEESIIKQIQNRMSDFSKRIIKLEKSVESSDQLKVVDANGDVVGNLVSADNLLVTVFNDEIKKVLYYSWIGEQFYSPYMNTNSYIKKILFESDDCSGQPLLQSKKNIQETTKMGVNTQTLYAYSYFLGFDNLTETVHLGIPSWDAIYTVESPQIHSKGTLGGKCLPETPGGINESAIFYALEEIEMPTFEGPLSIS